MNKRSLMTVGIGAGLLAAVGTGVALVATSADGSASSAFTTSVSAPPTTAPAPTHAVRGHPGSQTTAVSSHVAQPLPAHVSVPKLRAMTPPDVVVRLNHAATPAGVRRLERSTGVGQVAVLDRGRITLTAGHRRIPLTVVGVPLGTIRGFVPKVTAISTKLWRSVGRGELTVNYASTRRLSHQLGRTLPIETPGGGRTRLRIGAFATLGLPGAQALVTAQQSPRLHLRPGREVLVQAPKISLDALHRDLDRAFGGVTRTTVTRAVPVDQSAASRLALQTIPTSYLDLYRRAATTCPGLPWTVLGGIGTVETNNGRNVHRSIAGAEGPMQFEPSTWAMWGMDADGDGKADIHDATDAVFSAARYLCAAGASRGGQSLNDAIYAYNHAWWYVREVVDLANSYA